MRMNADLGDWERSLLNIPIGQSGQILSSHYKDQWTDYYNARSYPMQFGKVDAKSTLTFKRGGAGAFACQIALPRTTRVCYRAYTSPVFTDKRGRLSANL